MQKLRYHFLLFVVGVFLSICNPCKRPLTIRSRANRIAKWLMDKKEIISSKEPVPLLIKRRGAEKRTCIWIAKKLKERSRGSLAKRRHKRRILDCARKQKKRNGPRFTERLGRSISKGNTKEEILFEGDLKLNDRQKALLTRKPLSTGRKGRAGLKNVEELWPGGLVKYQLASGIWTESKEVIRNTLRGLRSKLGDCIRFQETDTGNRIFVNWSPNRSWSWHGYQRNVQNLDLKNGDFTPGIIQHEFLHAIGVLHTQARMDRDDYVQIFWDNIHPDDKNNFEKYDSNHFGLPYDFHSVMHYGGYACNVCGYSNGIRIKTHDPKMQSVRGHSQQSKRKLRKFVFCYSYIGFLLSC